MIAPLPDLSLRSTQPCVLYAGTSNPDCATNIFADSAEAANSPKTARRAFCDRGRRTRTPLHYPSGACAPNQQTRSR
eukprot:3859214-Prymnesium_polylepis.2